MLRVAVSALVSSEQQVQHACMHVQVRLQGCEFTGNAPTTLPVLLADNRQDPLVKGAFFSDTPKTEGPDVCTYEGDSVDTAPPACIESDPFPLSAAGSGFLSVEDPWYIQVESEAVRRSCLCCKGKGSEGGKTHAR